MEMVAEIVIYWGVGGVQKHRSFMTATLGMSRHSDGPVVALATPDTAYRTYWFVVCRAQLQQLAVNMWLKV